MINKQAISEFIKIYELEFGITLSLSEANQKAEKFMDLFKRVVEQNQKRRKVKNERRRDV